MKHRSIGAFILLAATLFAIPQAVEDIRSLKGSVLGSVRGELLQAFLSFNSDEAAPPSRRQARTALASCHDAARRDSAVASAAKKASRRAAPAGHRVESLEPSELDEFVSEEAEGSSPLPLVAEFVGEITEAVHEVAEVGVPAAPLPAPVALPASVKAERKGKETHGRTQWVSTAELTGRESAALDRLKVHQDILKIEVARESDLARALAAQRVRHFRVIRRKPAAAPAPPAGELPAPPRQVAETDEAKGAADEAARDAAWAAEHE